MIHLFDELIVCSLVTHERTQSAQRSGKDVNAECMMNEYDTKINENKNTTNEFPSMMRDGWMDDKYNR